MPVPKLSDPTGPGAFDPDATAAKLEVALLDANAGMADAAAGVFEAAFFLLPIAAVAVPEAAALDSC